MLKALELIGFKSFADKTRFDFPQGITAVVGPNGSGKSNVVDAIKWVLGEQSAKTLRGKEMADVIFNGSATRSPVNYAETTLTLDNRQHVLPIDTAEVQVTRRVYRNGEGEYLLNRQPCRLRDIRDLFSGTGVASEAYSVIEQGKVDAMLQSSPRDRRLIFEEAAGISRFKTKKVESLRRLERVEQNLLRLGDIVAEVEHRLRQVRLQASKARRYKEYSERLQELRTHVGAADWRELSTRLSALETDLNTLSAERDATIVAAEHTEQAVVALEARIAETDAATRATEARAAHARAAIAASESTAEHQRRRAAELELEAARLRRQVAAVSIRVEGLELQLQETSAQLATAESEHTQVAAAAAEHEQRLSEAAERLSAARRQVEQARTEHLAELRRAAQWESEAGSLAARLESARARHQQHGHKLSELTAAVAARAAELTAFDEQQAVLATSLDEQNRIERSAHERLGALSERQHKLQEELDRSREQRAAAAERASVLEEFERAREGYNAAVKEVLEQAQSRTPGALRHVLGVVAELLRVDVEMAPLIEAALGDRAQHVVVDSIDDLLAALKHQPCTVAGQVTFTPVEMRVHRAAPAVREVDLHGREGIVARADRLVHTSPEFVPLAVRLLGRTWIVENLPRAAELAHEHSHLTFVTLSGEVVSSDGTVSIGACSPAAGLITRRSELSVLSERVRGLEADIQRQTAQLAELSAETADVQASLAAAEQEHAHLSAASAELRLRMTAARERSTQLAEEERRCRADLASAATAADSAASALQTCEARRAAAKDSLATLEEKAETLARDSAALDQQRSAVEAAAAGVKIEFGKSEERVANLHLRKRQLEQDQRERRRTVDEVTGELDRSLARGREAAGLILEATTALASLYLDKEAAGAEIESLQSQQAAHRAERGELLAAVGKLRATTHELEERIHAQELSIQEVRHQRNTVADRLREDYGIELGAIEAPTTVDAAQERDKIDEEIAELRRKIAHIGNVNLDALDELEELESRFAVLSGQHQDLVGAKQSLVDIIERINTDSRRLFAETLEIVRANFQTLFRKLFGGGQADIVLDDATDMLECGIEIVARPPGKEPRNISLLSGGEKTLTCVALLLAIFQYRPSPFCVLDEVDAALDEANIERFIGVLQEFLAWTQFIVVTHSKKTMTCATTLYGVTMQESGVSKRVSVRFEDISADGELRPLDADPAAESSSDETQAA